MLVGKGPVSELNIPNYFPCICILYWTCFPVIEFLVSSMKSSSYLTTPYKEKLRK
jgi:hypothetical protein